MSKYRTNLFEHSISKENYVVVILVLSILAFLMLRILINYKNDKLIIIEPFPSEFSYKFQEYSSILILFIGTSLAIFQSSEYIKELVIGYAILLLLLLFFNYVLFWKSNMIEIAILVLGLMGMLTLWMVSLICKGSGLVIYWLFFIKLVTLAFATFYLYLINLDVG
jgi:hypothetical protein